MSSERRGRTEQHRPPLRELSFGGVLVRGDVASGTAEIAAIVPRGKAALALPKGGANEGESGAQTAAREVREETGLTGRLRQELGDVTYWYRRAGRSIRKTVRFYLFDFVSGSTDDHDHEVTEVRWIALEEAGARLTYPGEREMAEKALRALADRRSDR
jgi:8-oxo-dGTP pyrophosphatase MutT (NUDIX family)